ncbi:thiol:disulfide interchange protein DsbA/DsbL [Xylophilus sp.]|uniref:thiol:disulfide interchange protein DsbA/DsbL n=1 Tax=Xylophilus sp. TaxID=2653893 RepID=UPI002D800C57|nr:thiol:disulfide interchange protein DsbA/DsbL [Xylophilus sp.]
MQRRAFSVSAASAAVLSAVPLAVPGLAQAQGGQPQAGREYVKLDRPAPVDAPSGQIEVIEFFWYSCPHCNAFEPTFQGWLKAVPKDVVVRRVPIAFRPDFVPQQKLFYALEALGKVDALHSKVFHAVHVERQRINTDDTIQEWIEKQGGAVIDPAKFKEAYNSFGVANKVKRASQLQDAYRVEGVPALGVAGRYYTDGSLAGGINRALQVVDFLIGQVRGGKA